MPRADRPAMQLQAHAGQPLAIVLDASAGAGLLWRAPAAPAGCSLVADGQAAAGAEAGAGDGGGVQQRFVFTAAAAGTHLLRFLLQRDWEPQPQAVQPVSISVR